MEKKDHACQEWQPLSQGLFTSFELFNLFIHFERFYDVLNFFLANWMHEICITVYIFHLDFVNNCDIYHLFRWFSDLFISYPSEQLIQVVGYGFLITLFIHKHIWHNCLYYQHKWLFDYHTYMFMYKQGIVMQCSLYFFQSKFFVMSCDLQPGLYMLFLMLIELKFLLGYFFDMTLSIDKLLNSFKACVCYFLSNFYLFIKW